MSIVIQELLIRRDLMLCALCGSCGYQLVLLRNFRKMIAIDLKIYDFITEKKGSRGGLAK